MSALSAVVELWLKQIEAAHKAKEKSFSRQADECWKYYLKEYDDIYVRTDRNDDFPVSRYKLRLAKAREFVSLMVPRCHQKVPNRLVTPTMRRLPPDVAQAMPEAAQWQEMVTRQDAFRAQLMQWLLNYLPVEYGLNRETRIVLPEAFVKGRAIAWTEMVQSPAGLIPANCAESIDNLLIDPDAVQLRDAGYIVRIRNRSAYRVAEDFRQYGVTVDKLRSQATKSYWLEAAKSTSLYPSAPEGGDRITYFEVYSRVGVGAIFRDSPKEIQSVAAAVDSLDGNVWLAILAGVDHPLNLSPEMLDRSGIDDEVKNALAWPIAFHEDYANPWPFQNLDFLPNADNPWATSPLWGAVPLLRFLDGAYNFLFERIGSTCRDIHVTSQALEKPLQNAFLSGLDQTTVSVPGKPGDDMKSMVHTIQFPPLKPELFEAIRYAEQQFERHTGMTPLLSGAEDARQVRVAADIQARERNVSTRPDDYADAVEEWMSRLARAEAVAARLMIEPAVIAKLAREPEPEEPGTMPRGGWGPITVAWMQMLATTDKTQACSELEYSIEAGSGQRKNRAKFLEDATQISQVILPHLIAMAQAGNPEPYNALMALLGEGMDRDMTDFMLAPPPPPEEQPPPPDPEAEAEAMRAQQEAEIAAGQAEQEQAAGEADMAMRLEQHQLEMQMRAEKHAQEMALAKEKAKAAKRDAKRNREMKR